MICGCPDVANVLRMQVVDKVQPDAPDMARWAVCVDDDCRARLVAIVMAGGPGNIDHGDP